jgi:hypothetical protein
VGAGYLVFGAVLIFLVMVFLEKVKLKMRNAVLLISVYAGVVVGFGFLVQREHHRSNGEPYEG